MTTSASLDGSLTSQHSKFELSSTLCFSCHKNQGWPPQVYYTVHQIKPLSVAKTKGKFKKWYYPKSCSSVESIWNKLVKAQRVSIDSFLQACNYALWKWFKIIPRRCFVPNTDYCRTAHLSKTVCTHDPPKSIVYPALISSCLCLKYKKLKFSASCTSRKILLVTVGRINTPPTLITIVLITIEQKTYEDWTLLISPLYSLQCCVELRSQTLNLCH